MRGSCKVLVMYRCKSVRLKTYLCGLVSGGGDKVCAVCGELNVVDLKVELVGLDVFQLFARLSVVQSVSWTSILRDENLVHTLASYWLTLPSSCPAIMYLLK